jgi:hypothetical protein
LAPCRASRRQNGAGACGFAAFLFLRDSLTQAGPEFAYKIRDSDSTISR